MAPCLYAIAVYVIWVIATYLLEGLPRTLLRPGAVGLRLAYGLIANLAVGILLPLWLIRSWVRSGWASPADFGFSSGARSVVTVVLGGATGYALFHVSQAQPVHPLVALNTFAQVWVVSVAEIVVCWGLVGASIFVTLRRRSRVGAYLIAAIVAGTSFGIYHFAHSPPFNEPRMVAFLSAVGLATSAWWFASRDVYGTAVFHNFLALTGMLAAARAGGWVQEQPVPAIPLLIMAAVVTLALLIADIKWIRMVALPSAAPRALRCTGKER